MWTCYYKPVQLHGRGEQHRPDFGHIHGIPPVGAYQRHKQRPHGHILLLGGGEGCFCGEWEERWEVARIGWPPGRTAAGQGGGWRPRAEAVLAGEEEDRGCTGRAREYQLKLMVGVSRIPHDVEAKSSTLGLQNFAFRIASAISSQNI
jgi:hypothetical protein